MADDLLKFTITMPDGRTAFCWVSAALAKVMGNGWVGDEVGKLIAKAMETV